jgi:hypothetical protein
MKKLIKITQEYLIQCDNEKCDYKILNPDKNIDTYLKFYINMPCPQCGENLLTEQDYLDHLKLMSAIKFINKWFSWLTIFMFTKREKTYIAGAHNGITIKEKK